jgi:hypothetical protein
MRVVRAAEFGGAEVLVPGQAPEPAAGPGQVVVRARNTSTAPAMGDRRQAGRRAVLAAGQRRPAFRCRPVPGARQRHRQPVRGARIESVHPPEV